MRSFTPSTASLRKKSHSSRRLCVRWIWVEMNRSLDELLPDKPEARLRIYAWTPNDPPPGYAGLIKIGQTTKADVNARVRESQGQMQQGYTLHVDELAER